MLISTNRKAYFQKNIRLKVNLSSIAVTTVQRFGFAEYFASNAGVGSGMPVGVNGKCQLVLLDCGGGEPQIVKCHGNVFGTCRVFKTRRTDRKVGKEYRTHFHSSLSRTYQNSYTVNVYCCRLLLTETQCLSCSASYCTAHLLYKYCTNCTVCN